MLFKRRQQGREAPADEAALPRQRDGPSLLRDDRGLHHYWFLEMRLKEELARAARGATVFSLAVWEPRILPGDNADPQIVSRVTELILSRLRTYDIVAVIEPYRFVGLLLDADHPNAATVTYRVKADIQVRIPGAGRWRAGVSTFGRDGVDADGIIQSALRRLDEDARAA